MSKSGRKRRVSDDEILRVFRDTTDPVLTATEVAEELPIGKSGVHPRLRELAANGRLSRKDVGGRAVVWWIENHSETEAPAAPLKKLVGMLSSEEADRAEERSREWREKFNREMMGDEDTA
jgi:predicted transcriptional regulator